MIKFLHKTYDIYKQLDNEISKISSLNNVDINFIRSIINQYITLILYGDIENSLSGIIRGKVKTENIYSEAFFDSVHKFHRGLNPKDIKNLLKTFNIGIDRLKFLNEDNKEIIVFKELLSFRHDLAHNYKQNVPTLTTVQDMDDAIQIVDSILERIDNLFDKNC